MTGEITLRGRVLPVGGVREKALAARRAGIKTFILPKKNEHDLEQIPKRLRQDLNFVFVERMEQVLDVALYSAKPINKMTRTLPPISPSTAPPA